MFLHLDECRDYWIYYLQNETVADFLYVTCFYNVYALILIKYQLHFDFLVVFFYSAAKATPLPCIMIIEVCIFFGTNEW